MPNKRAPGQKLLTLPAGEDFIRTIDKNLKSSGYSNRSQFIRDAIIEKLQRIGVPVDPSLAYSPDRVNSAKVRAANKIAADALRKRRKPGNE
jgi:Arc/MetJ-type ribon-helix-helix transcriptional regulator